MQWSIIGILLTVTSIVAGLLIIWFGVTEPTPPPAGIFSAEQSWVLSLHDNVAATRFTDGTLIFIRTTREIVAVDPDTGEQVWAAESAGRRGQISPVVAGQIILAPELDGSVAAFATQDGELLWRGCNICEGYDEVGSIAVFENLTFVARGNDQLTAYDLQTGHVMWKAGPVGRALPDVATYDGQVILAADDFLGVFAADSGDVLWQETSEVRFLHGITMHGSILYTVTVNSRANEPLITAYDVASHDRLWSVPYPSTSNPIAHYLTISGNTLYVTGGNVLLALSVQDGQTLWQFEIRHSLQRAIATDQGLVLVRSSDLLYALDSATGVQLGRLPLRDSARSDGARAEISPLVFGTLVIIPVNDRTIVALPLSEQD